MMTRRIHVTHGKGILLATAVAAFLDIGALNAQSQGGAAPARPTFEVAAIKPSTADPSSSGIKTGHGRLDASNVTLKRCIMSAYAVGPNQIVGGPEWLDVDRFMINAKAEQPVDDDKVINLMTQSLLAERFKLTLHRDSKSIPAYVIEVAPKGHKLEKAPPGESGTNSSTNNTRATIEAHNTSMDGLARVLARTLDLPVVNQTGLDGVFNFKLEWIPEHFKSADGSIPEGPSLFTAIQEQLGLRLRSQKAPVEVLVIDHAEKPSAN